MILRCLLASSLALAASFTSAQDDSLVRGRKLFDSHCARCHNMGGTGGEGPSLARPSLRHAADDEALKALVLDAAYGDLWEAAGSMLRYRGANPVFRYPLAVAVRLRAGFDIRSIRPFDVITRVKAKVLFVHGDADRQVPVTHSEKMHEDRLRAGLPSEIWILPGGEHGFDNYPPEGIFWNRILDFLDRSLGGPPAAWDLGS